MGTRNLPFKIILGSSSKARKEILAEMGYEFTVVTADIDEKGIRRKKPEDLVIALAEAKADAIIQKLLAGENSLKEDTLATLLITADTVVVYQGTIREKPTSKEQAREYIKGYSGGNAAVVGSVLITNLKTGKRCGGWESAEVYFLEIPDEIIDAVVILLTKYCISFLT
ncbi:7-methyl-GTP pyrophosphatase isoform X2 [Neltuma alba]|uniref:7-methyl-GTP pyrophosphatase isoform X2 n=1 Tax=Neltuma alba TaxID=207710 RepID=UPI0010A59931|nr:7-methyl-GTP pyrophosphatase isoform X2 [Prosopis alba]